MGLNLPDRSKIDKVCRAPDKYQKETVIITPNLATTRLCDILLGYYHFAQASDGLLHSPIRNL